MARSKDFQFEQVPLYDPVETMDLGNSLREDHVYANLPPTGRDFPTDDPELYKSTMPHKYQKSPGMVRVLPYPTFQGDMPARSNTGSPNVHYSRRQLDDPQDTNRYQKNFNRRRHLSGESSNQQLSRFSSKGGLDEVDGRSSRASSSNIRRKSSVTDPIVNAFIRLTFLKVLLIDIGITLGDLVMDFVQSIHLILTPSSVNPVSLPFGLFLLASCWLPALIVPVHLGYKHSFKYIKTTGVIESMILIVLFIGFFPLIPTLGYFHLLLTPRTTKRERKRYKEVERMVHEIRSISSSIEAPIQLTTILYMMLRGILSLPFNQSIVSACLEDSLGRMACLPSIPMASVIFSILSIIKSMFSLNIYPLLSTQDCSVESMYNSFKLFLRYMPFSLSNATFRIGSYAFILVYLDYWSAIPFLLLFLINLVIFGFSFTSNAVRPDLLALGGRSSSCPPTPVELTAISTAGFSRAPMALPDSSIVGDSPSGSLKSNVSQRAEESTISRNILHVSSIVEENPNPHLEEPRKQTDLQRNNSVTRRIFDRFNSIRSERMFTPFEINEENSSIFFNAMSGMFFPSCHSHVRPFFENPNSSQDEVILHDEKKLLQWQKIVLKNQVYAFNIPLMIVLVVVWSLVAFTSFFNYNSNILDPFWFSVTFSILVISGVISLLLASELLRPAEGLLASIFGPSSCREERSVVDNGVQDGSPGEGFPVTSLGDDSTSGDYDELDGAQSSVGGKIIVAILLILIIIIPIAVAAVIYQKVDTEKPHVFLIHEKANSSVLELGILSAFTVHPPRDKTQKMSGWIESSCQLDEFSSYPGKILVVNSSNTRCNILMQRDNFFLMAYRSKATAVLILDNTPRSMWRVSSHYDFRSEMSAGLTSGGDSSNGTSSVKFGNNIEFSGYHIPTLMLREPDWSKYGAELSGQNGSAGQVTLVWNQDMLDLRPLFTCSKNNQIMLSSSSGKGCESGKHLLRNGSVVENICVESVCWLYGHKCPNSHLNSEFELNLECQASELSDKVLGYRAHNGKQLFPDQLQLSTPQGESEAYCCRGQEHDYTLLAVHGDKCFTRWREVDSWARRCTWSTWIRGPCLDGLVQVSRLCLVDESGCLIREYYTTACSSQERLQLCKSNPNKC